MQYANVPPRIANLIRSADGQLNDRLLARLHDEYSLDILLDLEEIELVGRSWDRAIEANRTEPTS